LFFFRRDCKNGTDGKDCLLAFISTSIFKSSRPLFLFNKEGTDRKNSKDLLLLAILGFVSTKMGNSSWSVLLFVEDCEVGKDGKDMKDAVFHTTVCSSLAELLCLDAFVFDTLV
jgi:hypothetical protein